MERKSVFTKNRFTISLLALGVVFISVGICREEVSIVFQKSINICLECIGIG